MWIDCWPEWHILLQDLYPFAWEWQCFTITPPPLPSSIPLNQSIKTVSIVCATFNFPPSTISTVYWNLSDLSPHPSSPPLLPTLLTNLLPGVTGLSVLITDQSPTVSGGSCHGIVCNRALRDSFRKNGTHCTAVLESRDVHVEVWMY